VNASIALASSLFTQKTSIALLTTYTILLLLYVGPPAMLSVMQILEFQPQHIANMEWAGISSPFSALFAIPLDALLKREFDDEPANVGNLKIVIGYMLFSLSLLVLTTGVMVLRLKARLGLSD